MEEENHLTIEEIKILEKDSNILKGVSIFGLGAVAFNFILELVLFKVGYDSNNMVVKILCLISALVSMGCAGIICEKTKEAMMCREDINNVIKKEKELLEQDKTR